MSQAGTIDIENANPQIPTQFNADDGSAVPIGNQLDILGETVANGAGSKPVYTDASGMTVTVNVQVGTERTGAPADKNDAGLVSFDDTMFTVDANGYVQLIGGGGAVDSIGVDANTAPGTDPVLPDSDGLITVTGAQVATGSTSNVIRTNSLAANQYTIEIQRSTSNASANSALNGVSHFSSNSFSVDSDGFVTLIGDAAAILKVALDAGTSPIVPSVGIITLQGTTVAAGTTPVQTFGSAASTGQIRIQRSQAIAAEDTTKVGLCNFDDGDFTVSNGFVSLSGTGAGQTITGNSGGALSPTAGNWNVVTSNSTVVFAGSGSTLTQNFGLSNLNLGTTLPSLAGGTNNCSVGKNALNALTTGSSNVVMGENAGDALNIGSNNVVMGVASLGAATTTSHNTLIGTNSGVLITTATGGNSALGHQTLSQLLTGNYNVAVGYQAGRAYVGAETNNIVIGNGVLGTATETNVTRIGANQNACYIDGIENVDLSVAEVVTVSSDQLGSSTLTAGTGITIDVGAGTITINAEDSGFVWQDDSGAISAAKNNGYFIIGTATATLPASPAIGDTIKFFVDHASQVLTLQANTGQIIRMGALVSSTAGTAVSTLQGDSVELVYRATNSSWEAINFVGTWVIS